MQGGAGWDRRCPACICGWSRRRAECAASKRCGAEKERLGEWPSAELAATFETVCGTATSLQASHNFQCTLGKARRPVACYSYLSHGSGSVLSKSRVDCEEVALRIFPLDRALQASHNSKSPPHSVPAKKWTSDGAPQIHSTRWRFIGTYLKANRGSGSNSRLVA